MASLQINDRGKGGAGLLSDGEGIRPVNDRLAVLNGLMVGLFISLGVWGPQVYSLRNLPVSPKYGSILLSGLLIIGLGGAYWA